MVRRLLVSVVLVVLGGLAMPADAASPPALRLDGSVGGRALSSLDSNAPLRLSPEEPVPFALSVTNLSDQPVAVPRVRFHGRVLGLTFFNFNVQIGLVVKPGTTATTTFELAMDGLETQATGLLEAELTLVSADGTSLVDRGLAVDVRGNADATYGMFALGVTVLTGVLLAGLLFRLATRRLPTNRWSRAWRFAIPGGGLGLVLTVGLSVLRVLVPTTERSLSLLLGGFVVGFVVGYLSPSQEDDGDPEAVYDDEVVTQHVIDLQGHLIDLGAAQPRSDATRT